MKKICFKTYDEAKVHAPSTFSEFIFYDTDRISVEASVFKLDDGFLMDKDCSANLHCYGPQNMDDHLFFLFPKSEGSMLNGVSIDKISCYMAESGYHFISSQRLNAYVLACRKDVFLSKIAIGEIETSVVSLFAIRFNKLLRQEHYRVTV